MRTPSLAAYLIGMSLFSQAPNCLGSRIVAPGASNSARLLDNMTTFAFGLTAGWLLDCWLGRFQSGKSRRGPSD